LADAIRVLIDDAGDSLPLTEELRRFYGGGLSLPTEVLYANFVQSIDGVVALSGVDSAGPMISGKSPADRFVMGLLRGAADAVMVGAGTLRDTPKHHWTADHIYPELAAEFGAFRRALGTSEQPRLVVVTASGRVDVGHPAIRGGATLLTTTEGARILREIAPGTCEVKSWDSDRVPLGEAVAWLREQGHAKILSEAGPTIMGQLVGENLLDDLFITVSPVLAGRSGAGRPGLVEGLELLPRRRVETRLASARRSAEFLLLRYSLR
jgi:riboflavin biosynthesis pyrimidine reductase